MSRYAEIDDPQHDIRYRNTADAKLDGGGSWTRRRRAPSASRAHPARNSATCAATASASSSSSQGIEALQRTGVGAAGVLADGGFDEAVRGCRGPSDRGLFGVGSGG